MDKTEAPDPERPDDAAESAGPRESPCTAARGARYSSPVCYAADFPEYFGADPETDEEQPGTDSDAPR